MTRGTAGRDDSDHWLCDSLRSLLPWRCSDTGRGLPLHPRWDASGGAGGGPRAGALGLTPALLRLPLARAAAGLDADRRLAGQICASAGRDTRGSAISG